MAVYRLGTKEPAMAGSAYVTSESVVVGDVRLGEHASVWFGAVIRADNEPITIGARSNVQEGAVLHADPGVPTLIGAGVTVGHQAMLHGCTVGDGTLIGIQAVVLNGAVIGPDCLVGAGALVTEGKEFPERSLILGSPAKRVRELTDKEVGTLRSAAEHYVEKAKLFRAELERID